MTDDRPVLKWCPDDFLVHEALTTRIDPTGNGPYQYLRLRKRGHSTFDAVAAVTRFAGIERIAVSYAGLKDEDAVTDQQICVHLPDGRYPIDDFNTARQNDTSYMHLTECGTGDMPMNIGMLDGNSFAPSSATSTPTSPIRSPDAATTTCSSTTTTPSDSAYPMVPASHTSSVVGSSSRTTRRPSHLSQTSGSTESSSAQSWHEEPAAFFGNLDPRPRSFYLSAAASHAWNQDVGNLIKNNGSCSHPSPRRDQLPVHHLRQNAATVALHTPEIPYTKHRTDDNGHIFGSNPGGAR
jgi:tRNA pseudouridine13 synthase